MNAKKASRLLTALTGMMAISITAVHAAAVPAPTKPAPAKAAAPCPCVTVKLGDAMLEEYHGGNPARRTTVLRGGDVAQKVKSGDSVKKRS